VTRALVTGGSGYFGTTMVEQLCAAGYRVRNLDLNTPEGHPPDVEFILGDIRSAGSVREACEGVDVVFHNVAQQPLAKQADLIESVNIEGTATLLRAAQEARVAKVVHTSSTSVYGVPARNPVDEQAPLTPVEVYGRAKARAEGLCREAAADGLDVTIMRPRTLVGHGRLGLFSILFDWVADGIPVFVFGRGDNPYQFVHAADMAAACILAGQREGPTSYNIGASEFGTMRETLEALVAHAGTGATVRSLPVKPAMLAMAGLSRVGLAPFGAYHWLVYGKPLWFDIAKAQAELGWEPLRSNDSMICEAYDWFTQHRSTLTTRGRSLHQSPTKQGALRLLRWASHAVPARWGVAG
jgi:nucleoside-diphosphate-sugar epimerase